MKKYLKYLLTGAVILIAVVLTLVKYWDYVANPWTRDGYVRANVIQITTRVSGPIVNLPIKDNQFVKKGELLFEIDPRTFAASVAQARAELDESGYDVAALERQVDVAREQVNVSRQAIIQAESSILEFESQIATNLAEYERQKILLPKGATSEKAVFNARTDYEVSVQQKNSAMASLAQSRASVREAAASLAEAKANLGAIGESNARVKAALAALAQAELNLEFTRVTAPADGYVTNLLLVLGSQTVANQPALALIDNSSFWVNGYFKETSIAQVEPGDQAVVTLMGYPDIPLEGYVESIGWGISPQEGSTGFQLLPSVDPTFEWIRLAQRIPVRVHMINVPEKIKLRIGTTASVLVRTNTASSTTLTPAPKALQ